MISVKALLLRDLFTCPSCGKRATEIHHIVEITEKNMHDPNITLNPSNLQSLCNSCHTLITNAEHRKEFDLSNMNSEQIVHGLYVCNPEKNDQCRKTACFIVGGPCRCTKHKEFAKEDLISDEEYVERIRKLNE